MNDDDPDRESPQRIDLTPEIRSNLREQIARTGKGACAVLYGASDKPEGLSASVIHSWLETAHTAQEDHLDYVLALYEATASAKEYVDWSAELVAELHAEQERTGVRIMKLLKGRTDLPQHLSAQRIYNLLAGRIVRISLKEIDYVRKLWRALPTVEFVALTPKTIAKLRELVDRTGKGPQAILRGARDKPDGLKSDVIKRWLAGAEKARKDHLDYVLTRYKKVADERNSTKNTPRPNQRDQASKNDSALSAHVRIWDMIGALSRASRDEPHLMLRLVGSESFQRLETSLETRGYWDGDRRGR